MSKKQVKKASTAPEYQSCAYIGPTVRGLIQTGTIYPISVSSALELPEVQRARSVYPQISHLIVPCDKLVTARSEIKKPSSILYIKCKEMQRQNKEV